jgi:hypothetical protein
LDVQYGCCAVYIYVVLDDEIYKVAES